MADAFIAIACGLGVLQTRLLYLCRRAVTAVVLTGFSAL